MWLYEAGTTISFISQMKTLAEDFKTFAQGRIVCKELIISPGDTKLSKK